jgi:hypothetical protein
MDYIDLFLAPFLIIFFKGKREIILCNVLQDKIFFRFLNEALEKAPALINSSPYGDGWIFKVKLSDKVDKKLNFQTFFSNLKNVLVCNNVIRN